MLVPAYSIRHRSGFNVLTGSPSLLLDERGQSVSTWVDQSGNGRDYTQATSLFQPATGRTINGLAALAFDGSNTRIDGPTLTSVFSASGYHGFFVVYPDAITSTAGSYLGHAIFGDTSAWFHVCARDNSGTKEVGSGHDPQNVVRSPITTGAAHIVDVSYNGTIISARLDAGSAGTIANGNIGGTSTTHIGWGNPAAQIWNGLIGQVVLFPNVLSAPDQAAWRTYLGAKWGVSV